VAKRLHDEGFYSDTNLSGETLKKKILEGQLAQWNYLLGMLSSSTNISRRREGDGDARCERQNPRGGGHPKGKHADHVGRIHSKGKQIAS
jgi:hypothetical protein